ncbi:hypothetical protein [Phycisphaera mikurensis]|nr:hypothetical protein [Phycisphaera mikurensis]MBB6441486.1 hypothetical protein [Phycisphaera mikurensis]
MMKRTSTLLALAALLLAAPALLPAGVPGAAAFASAQEITPEVRADFARLTRERSQAHAQLRKLDRQAADRVRDGRDATEVYAEQINTQDKLDLIQLRLELLATRYGLPLQPVEAPEASDGRDPVEKATDRVFSRGEARARDQLRRDVEDFLRSIDFSDFLAE